MKKILIIFSLCLFAFFVNAQETIAFEKAPKQYSFEVGGRYHSSSNFSTSNSNGITAMFDYAWKLSGYNKKLPVFLSVPIGYSYMLPNSSTDSPLKILAYGWSVRHELAKDKKLSPFMGYSLLLNQLSIDKVDGRIMGHQTKFDFGANYKMKEKLFLYVKLEYSYSSFPQIGSKDVEKIHSLALKLGFRI